LSRDHRLRYRSPTRYINQVCSKAIFLKEIGLLRHPNSRLNDSYRAKRDRNLSELCMGLKRNETEESERNRKTISSNSLVRHNELPNGTSSTHVGLGTRDKWRLRLQASARDIHDCTHRRF